MDLQLELSKQENTRLRTQADHLEKALEETRQTLSESEERERAVEAAASEAQHAKLVERINQLTILRESNATLRADCDSHSKRAKALEHTTSSGPIRAPEGCWSDLCWGISDWGKLAGSSIGEACRCTSPKDMRELGATTTNTPSCGIRGHT